MAGRGMNEGRSIADLQEISSDVVSMFVAVWLGVSRSMISRESFKLTHLSQLAH